MINKGGIQYTAKLNNIINKINRKEILQLIDKDILKSMDNIIKL